MSTVPTTVLTDAGIAAIQRAGTTGPHVKVAYYKLGSSLITPLPSMTDVANPVYQSVSNQIQYQVLSDSDVCYHVVADESVGDFAIGNIGIFLEDDTMFSITALPYAVQKSRNLGDRIGNYKIFDINFQIAGLPGITDYSLIHVLESAIPECATDELLQNAAIAPYPLYLVRSHGLFGSDPTLALRVAGEWWYTVVTKDGSLNMKNKKIVNLADPNDGKDAVNKDAIQQLIDEKIGDFDQKIKDAIAAVKEEIFQVGAYYMTEQEGNPADILGFGVWEQITGRFIVASGSTTDINGVEDSMGDAGEEWGEWNHTVSIEEMPNHGHPTLVSIFYDQSLDTDPTGGLLISDDNLHYCEPFNGEINTNTGEQIGGSGGGQPMNIIGPYRATNVWRRTE